MEWATHEIPEQPTRAACSDRQRFRAAAISRSLLPLLFIVAFTGCGVFESNRERCERKCGDDEAFYDPDDDTCFCRSQR